MPSDREKSNMPGRAVDLEDPNPFCSEISVENKSQRNYFTSVKRKDVFRVVKSQMKDRIMSLQSYHIHTSRQYTVEEKVVLLL